MHGINAIPTFVSLTVACFVVANRFAAEPNGRRWANYSRITGTAIAFLIIGGNVVAPLAERGIIPELSGLVQRVEIIAGWVWLSLTALRVLRQS